MPQGGGEGGGGCDSTLSNFICLRACRGLAQVTAINLASNNLTGSIPSEVGYLGALVTADFRNNTLTYDGLTAKSEPWGSQLGSGADAGSRNLMLPCFLTFSDYTMPRSDGSNIACPVLYRKTQIQALRDCASETQLVC